MTNMKSPKTFYIFYAWAEGPWFGRKLSEELKKSGFTEAPINEATVLIAHSIGTYLVRPIRNNKIVILVGPPLWPGKSMTVRLLQKVWHDRENVSFRHWVYKLFWNTFYIITKPIISIRAIRAGHLQDPLSAAGNNSIVIQNANDVFCAPDLSKLLKQKVISLPGQHDDCWYNPTPYLKIIDTKYRAL